MNQAAIEKISCPTCGHRYSVELIEQEQEIYCSSCHALFTLTKSADHMNITTTSSRVRIRIEKNRSQLHPPVRTWRYLRVLLHALPPHAHRHRIAEGGEEYAESLTVMSRNFNCCYTTNIQEK